MKENGTAMVCDSNGASTIKCCKEFHKYTLYGHLWDEHLWNTLER